MLIGLLLVLIVLILFGVPVLLAIGAVGFAGFLAVQLHPALFPQKMFAAVDSFSLLALPYFILAGEIMSRGGLGKRLVEFAEAAVGHLRGGLGQASVVANMVFANVSGSATAGTSAIGSILIPSMKERGYKPGFAASLIACSGVIGSIIPPSMVMIVYGSMVNVSIGGLFLAGILPGLLIVGLLMLSVWLHSFHPAFPELRQAGARFRWRALLGMVPRVWAALLAPVIVLGGILAGIFTATEAGVVACVYALVVSMVFYRSVSLRDLPAILARAAVTNAVVVGIIAVAGALGFLLTYLDFTDAVMGFLSWISDRPGVVLVALVVAMMLLTMFIESLAVLIIVTPVIMSVGARFGFDPYYLGMLMVMATQIGSTTPPVAVQLFVATSIAETSYDQTLRYCVPFIVALMLALVLVGLFPFLATAIPNHFMAASR